MTEDEYRADALAKGYDEPNAKSLDAGWAVDEHTHDRSFYLLITGGEVKVACDGGPEQTYRTGDTIVVEAHQPHTEYAGPEGVQFLVAGK